jgi:hypothetical protein
MRTIVAGSRLIEDYSIVVRAIEGCDFKDKITEVVSGKAIGVDTLGERWAEENGLPVKPFPVEPHEWILYGKSAGYLRNEEMADYADALILIWTGDKENSPGSHNMLEIAKCLGLKTHEVVIDTETV